MQRRRYLSAIAIVATTTIAGCSGGDGSGSGTTDGETTATDESTPSATETAADTATATETATETGTQATTETANKSTTATKGNAQTTVMTEAPDGSGATAAATEMASATGNGSALEAANSPQLTVSEENLSVNTEGDIPTAAATALVENSGPMTGTVTATATFYNSAEDAITTENDSLAALPSGKRWTALVLTLGDGAAEAEDFDLAIEYNPTPPKFTTDGLKVLSSDLAQSDGEVTVTGEVENTTSSILNQLTATIFYHLNEAGDLILASQQDSTDSLESGGTWSHQVSTSGAGSVVGYKTRYTYG